MKGRIVGALAAAAMVLGSSLGPAVASAAPGADPLYVFRPERDSESPIPVPPPAGSFDGPCGLAVDSDGRLYVSDYYHHAIDVYAYLGYSPVRFGYTIQLAKEDPLDGPCALALDPGGDLYVNNFHRNVIRFGDLSSFGAGTIVAGAGIDSSYPTGVAVGAGGTVYVDERDSIAAFDAAGVEGEPIGEGSLQDGYGVAVSGYPATAGFLYVPDAATDTVKVYDPSASTTDPVAEIDGAQTPPGRFVSLRNASIAVDDSTGTVYVVDDLTPAYTEGHEGVVYAFAADGGYLGRLKHSVETALPAGLAVDNSGLVTQSRVYVTSGYAELAAVYVYGPESAGTSAVPLSDFAAGASPASFPSAAPPLAPPVSSSGAPQAASTPSSSPPEAPAGIQPRRHLRAKAKKGHHHRHHGPAGRKRR